MKILRFAPARYTWQLMTKVCPSLCVSLMYHHMLGKWPDLKNPKDLNEKIQYLKLHEDMRVWARLADKYAVRGYIQEKGLENILPKLYGQYTCSKDLMNDWENLPDKFVIKTNNGCATVLLVRDKNRYDRSGLEEKLAFWLKTKDTGLGSMELHYTLIKPCLIVEELLEDVSIKEFSRSVIDYKIWCFNGAPFCILTAYDREIGTSHHYFDCYDLDWNQCTNAMRENSPKVKLPKPKNFDKMLEYASVLSSGHKQMRVDLYNIDGKIYFGELTMTAKGGHMSSFTQEYLDVMGSKINL